MEDQKTLEALQAHNNSLKDVLEQLTCERNALDQTVTEVLRANIALKAGCAMLELRNNKLAQEIAELKAILSKPPETTNPQE